MTAREFPAVQGECPRCGSESLFLGADGYVTCARLSCESPWAASEALGVVFPVERAEVDTR